LTRGGFDDNVSGSLADIGIVTLTSWRLPAMNILKRFRFALVWTAPIAMLGALAMWVPCAAAGVPIDEVWLGDAPRLDVPQDTSGWRERPTPKTAQGATDARALAISAAVQTRDGVAQLYKNVYVPGTAVALNWTGDVAGCNAGTTNLEHRQAVIDRVNYARALVGLPPVTLLDGLPTTQAQSAALMFLANSALSHTPPMSWLCFSTDGSDGAGHSNISLGAFGVHAIDNYLDDTGTGNSPVGHRRWILFPPQVSMATGDVFRAASQPFPGANALYVLGTFGARPATPGGIAWPPAGFVPYQNLPSTSKRWSFSYPGADFTGATVTMTGPAGPIPVTLEAVATGYGDNTIVFVPTGVSYGNPGTDTTYRINVSGMTGTNVPSSIEYTVTVIDPMAIAPTPTIINYQGLWWNAPALSESGWGINFAHQGEIIFATWFTYDATGKALWLSMIATRTADGVYSGALYQTHGPAFSAVPFNPAAVTTTPVGSGTLTFSDANNGTFAYIVNGIAQTKAITREVFGPLPTCTFGGQPNLALATNYQDLWYAAPAESEAGWGVNFTHQGDIIFATWFTYDVDGTPLWLAATVNKTATGVYTGTVYRTTGPAFSAVPFLPANVVATPVGTLTLTFSNGNSATFAYTVNGVTQSKPIVRQVFRTPGTVCQ
jgi:hypothetical protein